jgi:lysozyme
MYLIEEGLKLAKEFEGYSPIPYLCPGGFWTIGWGHRCQETTPGISVHEADEWLVWDLTIAMKATLRQCPELRSEAYRLVAITDFTFNLGEGRLKNSTLRRRINEGNWDAASYELSRWVYAGKPPIRMRGLKARREAEIELFNKI